MAGNGAVDVSLKCNLAELLIGHQSLKRVLDLLTVVVRVNLESHIYLSGM